MKEGIASVNPFTAPKSLKDVPNSFVLGKPGAGMSITVKRLMLNTLKANPGQVIILDPEAEYKDISKSFKK